jgi:hypothetical protein
MWTLKTWVCTEQQIHKTRKKLLSVLQFWKWQVLIFSFAVASPSTYSMSPVPDSLQPFLWLFDMRPPLHLGHHPIFPGDHESCLSSHSPVATLKCLIEHTSLMKTILFYCAFLPSYMRIESCLFTFILSTPGLISAWHKCFNYLKEKSTRSRVVHAACSLERNRGKLRLYRGLHLAGP